MSSQRKNKKAHTHKAKLVIDKMDVDVVREIVEKSKEERKPEWIKIYNILRETIITAAKDGAHRVSIQTPNPHPVCANMPATAKPTPDGLDEYKTRSMDYWCDFVAFAREFTGMDVDIWVPKDQTTDPKQFVLMFQWQPAGGHGVHTCDHDAYDPEYDE